jgi:hypothetical protein
MSGGLVGLCWSVAVPAVLVSVVSAIFFVTSVSRDDRPLAWATLVLYAAGSLGLAVCSWRIWFEGAA